MTIQEFIDQYGTRTASLMIRNHVRRYPADRETANEVMEELADDLENFLESYLMGDVE